MVRRAQAIRAGQLLRVCCTLLPQVYTYVCAWAVGVSVCCCREERDISTRAIATLDAALRACAFKLSGPAAGSEYTLSVTAVPTCSGTVTLVFCRGKAKPGYEMNVTASWQLADAASSAVASGSVTFVDLCDSEGSDMFARLSVECTDASGSLDKSGARTTALRGAEPFRQALREWVESLKSM